MVFYEKGFYFIYYFDKFVGCENFDKFIFYYFSKWVNKFFDLFEFKDIFFGFFSVLEYVSLKNKIVEIDWEGCFYNIGFLLKFEFDILFVDECYKLVEKWKQKDFQFSLLDIEGWIGN